MPIFTGTPIITISTTPWQGLQEEGRSGPFVFGGNLYMAGQTQSSSQVAVCKSTDGGNTWTQVVAALDTDSVNNIDFDPILGKILFVGLRAFTSIAIQSCDINGGTPVFTLFDSGVGAGDVETQRLCIRPNGSAITLWRLIGSPRVVRFMEFSGGAFGAPGVLDTVAVNHIATPCTCFSDSTGVIQIAESDENPGLSTTSFDIYYITLSAGNVPGVRQTMATAFFLGDDLGGGFSRGIIWANPSSGQNEIIFPVGERNKVGDLTIVIGFFRGTPAAAPVWTFNDLYTAATNVDSTSLVVVDDTTRLRFLYFQETTHADPNDFTINEVDYDGAVVGPEQVFWDIVANPPSTMIGDTSFTVDGLTAALVPGGLGVGVWLDNVINPGDHATTIYLLDGGPVALGIICDSPPAGQVGTAYSHTFPASGGTAPYTFAITAGALPTGLSLGAGTGIVSGTPTVKGTFTFTIQVTDSVLATASVECSIVISSKCLESGAA